MDQHQSAGLRRPDPEETGQAGLDFAQREVVLRASFDEADSERRVWTSMRFILDGPRHPRVGEQVFLIDRDDGGGCLGMVEELNGWQALIRLLPPDPTAAKGV
jgi:hypothetical protein